jgi:PAS domain S-box-containing protein
MFVTAFLGCVHDTISFKDRAGRYIAVSKSKAARHGYQDPAELVGKTDFDLFNRTDALLGREGEEEIMRTGIPIVDRPTKVRFLDGHEAWMLVSRWPLRDERGEIVGTFAYNKDITEIKRLEAALEKAHRDLVDASRQAGMAEIAVGVLHNVGNTLNSVNISANLAVARVRQSRVGNVGKVAHLLHEQKDRLVQFFTADPRGGQLPEYLTQLGELLLTEQMSLLAELQSLQQGIDVVKQVVAAQQNHARSTSVVDRIPPVELLETALQLNKTALMRNDITVVREFAEVPMIEATRPRLLQILAGLVCNAIEALDEGGGDNRRLTVGVRSLPGRVRIFVSDNGVGIDANNLTRVFNLGFTTKKDGHGFALHSSGLAAKEMGGSLLAESAGLGFGATFSIEFPVAPSIQHE